MSDNSNRQDVRRAGVRGRFHIKRKRESARLVTSPLPVAGDSKRRLLFVAGAVLMAGLSMGVSMLTAKYTQRDTVVFDMKNTIDVFKQQTAQKALDENAARMMTERFGRALSDSLSTYQAEHNDLILVSGAVVQPTLDITPEIQADIARRMQEMP